MRRHARSRFQTRFWRRTIDGYGKSLDICKTAWRKIAKFGIYGPWNDSDLDAGLFVNGNLRLNDRPWRSELYSGHGPTLSYGSVFCVAPQLNWSISLLVERIASKKRTHSFYPMTCTFVCNGNILIAFHLGQRSPRLFLLPYWRWVNLGSLGLFSEALIQGSWVPKVRWE